MIIPESLAVVAALAAAKADDMTELEDELRRIGAYARVRVYDPTPSLVHIALEWEQSHVDRTWRLQAFDGPAGALTGEHASLALIVERHHLIPALLAAIEKALRPRAKAEVQS